MSKNVALILSELVVAIVFATVVPDWECKSRKFILIYKRWSKNYFHELKNTSNLAASSVPVTATSRPTRHECAI
jgi:hypothetical protein